MMTLSVTAFSQLAPGSTLPGNITGKDVLTDEDIDVQAWLDEGKAVVIDVFATWCGPCWTFHTSGWLEEMNELYGPEGTDQIRIVGIESDSRTPSNLLYEAMSGGTFATTSLGNWTVNPDTGEPLNYSIMENEESANTLSIGYYPSLYIIKPSGVLVELGTLSPNPRFNEEFWLAAMDINEDPYALMSGDLGLTPFCFELNSDDADFSFVNPSSTPIESASVDLYINGMLEGTYDYDGAPVEAFQTGMITVPGQTYTQAAEVSVVLSNVNGEAGEFGEVEGEAEKYELATEKMTIKFTTDFYALETSWRVVDEELNTLLEVGPYMAGPEAYGGGGADANRTFEYELEVNADVECLNFIISDSYGDGLGQVTQANLTINEPPGIEVIDQWGNEVKTNEFLFNAAGDVIGWTGEGFNWGNQTGVLVNAEQSTGIETIDELNFTKVYPNPVANLLNIELGFEELTDYNVTLIDVYGQAVKTLGNYSNNFLNERFDVSELSSGIYFVAIQSDKGQNIVKFTKI